MVIGLPQPLLPAPPLLDQMGLYGEFAPLLQILRRLGTIPPRSPGGELGDHAADILEHAGVEFPGRIFPDLALNDLDVVAFVVVLHAAPPLSR